MNEAGAIYNRLLSKPLVTEVHRKNRLKWAQDNKDTNWEHVIFLDETNIRRNTIKRLGRKLTGKKDPSNRRAFDQGERKSRVVFQVKVLVASSLSSRI